MAQYNDLIAGLTVGSYGNGNGTLAGFTQLWAPTSTARTYTVNSDAAAPSGKSLRCAIGATSTRTLLGVDAISADASRGICEVIAKVRSNTPTSGTLAAGHGIAFNGSGAAASETAQAITLGRGTTSHILRRQPYAAGSAGSAVNSSSIESVTGGASPIPFWIQALITPTTWTMRAYADGDLDGTIVASATGSHSLADGVVGFFNFLSSSYMDFLYVSAGTGGDSAPRPTAAVPAGTTTVTGVTPLSTSASVAWTYSAADQTGFEYRLDGGSSVSAGTSSPFNITGLTASTLYDVEVRAVNGNGAGSWSAPFEFTTDAAPALPPEGTVTITGVTPADTSALVAFTYDESDQTGFEYRLDGGTATSAGSSSPYNVTGLTASTTYDVEIRAVNAAGGGAWSAPFEFTTDDAPSTLLIDTVFDLSNISSVSSTVTDPSSAEPIVFLTPRARTMTPDGSWRNIVGKLTGCVGKRPFVRFDRSTQDGPTSILGALWRCCWTTDFVTFNQFPAADVSSGTGGYYQVQAADAWVDDIVYVMMNPMYPQSQSDAFAANLLSTYSTVASPGGYAVAAKITNPSWPDGAIFVTDSTNDYPVESGEAMSGFNLGSLAIYGITLDWGLIHGGTTDGGQKRNAVLAYGQHAQGEAQASISYFGAITWLLTSADEQAINLRRNFRFFLRFNINGSGIKGGHRRLSYGTGTSNTNSTQDFNRTWDAETPNTPEVRYTRDSIVADTGGAAAVLIDWHGTRANRGDYNTIESSIFDVANNAEWNTLAATHFNMANADIASVDDVEGYIINFANTALNVDYATHAEHANRGSNSKENLESVGVSWLRTLQSADAGGMFYTPPLDTFNWSIASTLPLLSSSGTFTSVVPEYNSSVNSVLPKPTSSMTLGLAAPEYNISIASILPKLTSNGSLESVPPGYNLGISSTLPLVSSSMVLSSYSIPEYNIQVNSLLPKVISSAAMTFIVPEYSSSINSTLPRLTSYMGLNSQGLSYFIPSGNMVFIKIPSNFINLN